MLDLFIQCVYLLIVYHIFNIHLAEQPLVEPKNPKITGPWLVLLELVVWGELNITCL